MVQNPEEPTVFTATPGGLNRGVDVHDVPFGQFARARNILTVADQAYMRTRDGLVAVTDRLFTYQFPILDTVLPWIVPFNPIPDSTEGELRLAAFPNRDLEASSGSPLSITFVVAGGGDLGITTFEWDFSFDGVTRNVEASGTSTSQVKVFTTSGRFRVIVSGTGSDTREYTAEVTLDIDDADNPDLPIPPIPDVPPDEPPPDPIETVLPEIFITVRPTTIGLGDSAEVTWFAMDSDSVTFYFPDGSTEEVGPSGTKVVTPTAVGTEVFTVDAFNSAGFTSDSATLTIQAASPVPEAGYLIFPDIDRRIPGRLKVSHLTPFNLNVESREKISETLASFPGGVAPILVSLDFDKLVSASFDSTPTLNAAKTIATFSGNVLALPSGTNLASGAIQSYVVDANLERAIADVTLYRQTADFKVEVVDISGTAFPSDRIETILSGDFVEAEFYLKISALDPGTSNVKTDFALDGLVSDAQFEGFPDDPSIQIFFLSFKIDPYDPTVEQGVNLEFIDGEAFHVIPAGVWQKGTDKGIVMLKVEASFFKKEGNITDAHFVGVEFSCRERLSSE